MSSGSLVVLKDIRCNNLYYLKGSAVTENLSASKNLKSDSIRLWQMRLGHIGLDYLHELIKQKIIKRYIDLQFEIW